MASDFSRFLRAARRGRVRRAGGLRLERLEARDVPSTTIPLSGVEWTPLGPSPVTAIDPVTGAPSGSTVAPANLPTGGRTLGVAAALTDTTSRTYFAATGGGGVARTTDAGLTWTHLTDNLGSATQVLLDNGTGTATIQAGLTDQDRSLVVGSVAVNPYAPVGSTAASTVWAGEGDSTFTQYNFAGRGILKSTNNGNTWQLIKGPITGPGNLRAFDHAAVRKFVFHPTDVNTVWAVVNYTDARYAVGGRNNAVWRTRDGGQSWVDVTQNLDTAPGNGLVIRRNINTISDFVIDPQNPEIGYVTIGNPNGYQRNPLADPPAADNLNGVYRVAQASQNAGVATGTPATILWQSLIGGTSSVQPGQGNRIGIAEFALAPGLPSTSYGLLTRAGGGFLALFRSTSSGGSYDPVPVNLTGFNPGGAAINLLIDPSNAARVILAGRNGLILSEDATASIPTWRDLSLDATGEGPQPVITDVQFVPQFDATGVVTDPSWSVLVSTNAGVYRLLPGWKNGGTIDWVSANGRVGPAGPDAVEIGAPQGGLGATQFFYTGLAPDRGNFSAAGLPTQGADNVIGTTWLNGTVNFTDPGTLGGSPTSLFAWPPSDNRVENGGEVIYNFSNPNIVLRATSSGNGYVLRSTDGGKTWNPSGTGISGNTWNDPNAPLVMDPSNANILYYGTDKLWRSDDGGVSWTQYGKDLPLVTGRNGGNNLITSIGIGRSDSRIVYVGVNNRTNAASPPQQLGPAVYNWDPNYRSTDNQTYWRDVSPGRRAGNGFATDTPLMSPDPNPAAVPDPPGGLPNDLTGVVTDMAVDQNDFRLVYLTVETAGAGRVWTTGVVSGNDLIGNEGLPSNAWRDITGSLPVITGGGFRTYSIVLDPREAVQGSVSVDDDLYVATEVGVYKLTNPVTSTSWFQLGLQSDPNPPPTNDPVDRILPDVMVRDLKLDLDQGILSAATFGRGVWQYQIRPFVSGFVFEDQDGDGVQETGDGGLGGVSVTLFDPGNPGVELANTTTDDNGFYVFQQNLTNGNREVRIKGIAGGLAFQQTTPVDTFTIAQTTTRTGVNIGAFIKAPISGTVFNDTNGDGVRQPAEAGGVAGATLQLFDQNGAPVDGDPNAAGVQPVTTNTLANGTYTFPNIGVLPTARPGPVPPGGYTVLSYVVRMTTVPTGWVVTSPPASGGNYDLAVPAFTSGTGSSGNDFGLFKLVGISGVVYQDDNGNGVRDGGEPGVVGRTVYLDVNANGSPDAGEPSQLTDGLGAYAFTGLSAGTYRVRLAPQAGSIQTSTQPADISARSGVDNPNVNFGVYPTSFFVTVSGRVGNDLNGNGVVEDNEPGIAGVAVRLVNAATGGQFGQTVFTDGNGNYSLPAPQGRFAPRQTVPAGFVQTSVDPAFTDSQAGADRPNQNFADFLRFPVTGLLFNDLNGNGVRDGGEPGLAGRAVTLTNLGTGGVLSATTDGNGAYAFSGVTNGAFRLQVTPPAGSVSTTAGTIDFQARSGQAQSFLVGEFALVTVSGTVFEDLDRNKALSAGEAGLSGFTVELLRDGAVVGSTVTTNGAYAFAGIGPGAYSVRATLAGQPGFVFTTAADGTAFATRSGSGVAGGTFGVLRLGSISGTVFLDNNKNGARDGNETPITDATVAVFDAAGALVAQTRPAADGTYAFFNLEAGDYTVRLVSRPAGLIAGAGGSERAVTLAIGSGSAGNSVTGVNFGLTGTQRYTVGAGSGGGPRIQVYDSVTNTRLQDDFVYELSFTGGVRAATGDVNGDGIDDLVVVPGKGGAPRVRVISGADKSVLFDDFVYETSFRDGLFVAIADVNGDGYADIVTGTDAGGGPRVTVTSGKDFTRLADYFAYDPGVRSGVRVAGGDLNNDGVAEVVTGTGVGGGPLVRIWSPIDGKLITQFFAFETGYTGGVYVAASGPRPDGRPEVVVGQGATTGAQTQIKAFDVRGVQTAQVDAFSPLAGKFTGEARVAVTDRNGDGYPDIVVAAGPNSPPRVRFIDGRLRRAIGDEQLVYESTFTGGVFVG